MSPRPCTTFSRLHQRSSYYLAVVRPPLSFYMTFRSLLALNKFVLGGFIVHWQQKEQENMHSLFHDPLR